MNTYMYEHPLTARHLDIIKNVIGYAVVGPIGKTLACGDIGMCGSSCDLVVPHKRVSYIGVGAMTEWSDIVQLVGLVWGRRRARVKK